MFYHTHSSFGTVMNVLSFSFCFFPSCLSKSTSCRPFLFVRAPLAAKLAEQTLHYVSFYHSETTLIGFLYTRPHGDRTVTPASKQDVSHGSLLTSSDSNWTSFITRGNKTIHIARGIKATFRNYQTLVSYVLEKQIR